MSRKSNILDGGTLKDVLNVGGKGLVLGAGTASAVALIRQLLEAKRQNELEKKRKKEKIDENTIVLHIAKNKKEASACDGTKPITMPLSSESEIKIRKDDRLRKPNGRYTETPFNTTPHKKASFTSDVLAGSGSIIAAGGGAVLGYALLSKIARKLEQHRLKKQIEAAQTEYINLLDGKTEKNAEAFSKLFLFDNNLITDEPPLGLDKKAGVPSDIVNLISRIPTATKGSAATLLAAWLLGAGASAYVTKRILENKFDTEEEEKPTPQTKILFKSGESQFELQPDLMLATIGVLRDCISDSLPPGIKVAKDEVNYSFLDDIEKLDGGRQWLLDQYAIQKGLKRDKPTDIKLPISLLLRHGSTLKDIKNNPSKHAPGIKTKVMSMMNKDPKGWFNLLGDSRNYDIVRLKADQQLENLRNSDGLLGFLHKIPILGNFIANILKFYSKTSLGNRHIASNTLKQMGITGERANNILSRYNITNNGWTLDNRAVREKTAGFLDDGVLAALARNRTLTDASNQEVIKIIEELKQQISEADKAKKTRKRMALKDVNIEFDPELLKILSEDDIKKIKKLTKG